MEWTPTMAMKLKTKNNGKYRELIASPFLALQMSKRFYDTSTSAAIGAARCGSFVGKGFSLLVVRYGRTWWT
jgi:hypothetical protein